VKEDLFACGKDEFFFAIYTLEHSIRIFHGRLFRMQGNRDEIGHLHAQAGSTSVSLSCLRLDCNGHSESKRAPETRRSADASAGLRMSE
jgi:hypothetical protein